jgi:uncharacterized protein YndB with AHSA1/START domain
MSMETNPLSFNRIVHASPAETYRAFTNSTALREWMCDFATTAPRVGGRFYLAWNDGYYTSGEFKALEPEKLIVFTWHGRGEPAPSQVAVKLTLQDEDTAIDLKHTGLGEEPEWKQTREEIGKGWEYALENLSSIFATGEDLRLVRRPMLGITVSDFDADIAKNLNIPVTEGIRLDTTIEGMSAAAAGLQKDDVIVGIDRQDASNWNNLANALQSHQAGDEVEVVFYRGPEKKTVTMKLSGRPIPEIPESPAELAQAISKIYAEGEKQLDELFEGVSEEQASFKPAPGEWSIKENLAHLIHSQRGWHTSISDLIEGQEAQYDDFGGNVQARVTATVAAYPTLKALREELRRSEKETVTMIAELPEKLVARKGSYWRLAYNLIEDKYHLPSHLDQMRAALDAAREAQLV